MKVENLTYVECIDKYGNTPGLTMPGGFFVFKATMFLAWQSVHRNWPNIDWTKKQTAETLISSGVWQSQVDGAKRALGRCVRFFVKHDMLPFPLALAKTRKGKPYKGGRRFYVAADTVDADAVPVMEMESTRAARNKDLIANVDWAALQKTAPPTTIGEPLP